MAVERDKNRRQKILAEQFPGARGRGFGDFLAEVKKAEAEGKLSGPEQAEPFPQLDAKPATPVVAEPVSQPDLKLSSPIVQPVSPKSPYADWNRVGSFFAVLGLLLFFILIFSKAYRNAIKGLWDHTWSEDKPEVSEKAPVSLAEVLPKSTSTHKDFIFDLENQKRKNEEKQSLQELDDMLLTASKSSTNIDPERVRVLTIEIPAESNQVEKSAVANKQKEIEKVKEEEKTQVKTEGSPVKLRIVASVVDDTDSDSDEENHRKIRRKEAKERVKEREQQVEQQQQQEEELGKLIADCSSRMKSLKEQFKAELKEKSKEIPQTIKDEFVAVGKVHAEILGLSKETGIFVEKTTELSKEFKKLTKLENRLENAIRDRNSVAAYGMSLIPSALRQALQGQAQALSEDEVDSDDDVYSRPVTDNPKNK